MSIFPTVTDTELNMAILARDLKKLFTNKTANCTVEESVLLVNKILDLLCIGTIYYKGGGNNVREIQGWKHLNCSGCLVSIINWTELEDHEKELVYSALAVVGIIIRNKLQDLIESKYKFYKDFEWDIKFNLRDIKEYNPLALVTLLASGDIYKTDLGYKIKSGATWGFNPNNYFLDTVYVETFIASLPHNVQVMISYNDAIEKVKDHNFYKLARVLE
jgi:hypothetical protein